MPPLEEIQVLHIIENNEEKKKKVCHLSFEKNGWLDMNSKINFIKLIMYQKGRVLNNIKEIDL